MLHEVIDIDTQAAALADYAPALDHQLDLSIDALDTDDTLDAAPQPSFADQLLQALAAMAVRSKRRQADLCAALHRSGLDRDPVRVTEALRHLERVGCIEQLVPLYDGGVLMSVTSRGIETLSAGPRWTMLDGAGLLRA